MASSHKVRPGSAGFAMPGYRMVVLDEAGQELGPNQPGILAVDIANSPLRWFERLSSGGNPGDIGGYYRTRRHGRVRAGRLGQLHRPRRRRHHLVRLPHWAVRRRKRADRASGGQRGSGGRRARSAAHRDRQGLRHPGARLQRQPGTGRGTARSMSASGSRPTPIRARSNSSPNCRRRRAARSSVSC